MTNENANPYMKKDHQQLVADIKAVKINRNGHASKIPLLEYIEEARRLAAETFESVELNKQEYGVGDIETRLQSLQSALRKVEANEELNPRDMGALKQGPETLDALIAHRTILMNSSKERFKPQNEQERPPLDEEKESKQLGEEAGLIVGDRQAIAALTNTKLLLEALTYKIQGRSRGKD